VIILLLQEQIETGPTGGSRGWDEEDERQLWLTVIQQAAITSLGQRQMLREESQLLEHAVKAEEARQSSSVPQDVIEARQAAEEQQKEEVRFSH
jgi:hypothetical protein